MAALLRQGARRIGGSLLQRTQAAATSPAVAEERRRLVPRRMATDTRATDEITREIQRKQQELADAVAKGRSCLMASTNWRDPHARPSALEIQQQKDELYELLSQVENRRNRRLLQDLAVHVYPRQPTMQWRRLRASKWATNVVRVVGNVTFAVTVVAAFDHLRLKVRRFGVEDEETTKALTK
ncbi:unnamed protein product [Alopecurus aequalis]